MKLSLLLLLILALMVPVSSHSQAVTLTANGMTLEKLFNEFRRQTGYQFIYTKDQVQNARPVSCKLRGATIGEAMEACMVAQSLRWTIEDHYVVISEGPVETHRENKSPPFDIEGIVMDENDNIIAGATVSVKGLSPGTSTDQEGMFRLRRLKIGSVLTISSIGFEEREIIADAARVTVRLRMKVNELDQAVVIGYGITSRRYNVGAVSRITAADISQQPVGNPLAAIQGRAPGVFVQTENGLPGGNTRIQIRGQGSVAAGTNPLYVIDGVPFLSAPFSSSPAANGANGQVSPFSIINPADIQSIEVLKDAEAAAIYGSRAANGVVLITTRRGNTGHTKFDLDIYKGMGNIGHRAALLKLEDYLQIRKEAFSNAGLTPVARTAPDLLLWDQHSTTDWQKYLFGGTAHLTNIQASLSGGKGGTSFFSGINFRREGTVLPGNNGNTRVGGHLSVDHLSPDQKLSVSAMMMLASQNNRVIHSAEAASFINLAPNFPIYNADGSLNWATGENPAALLLQRSESRTNNLITNVSLRYKAGRQVSVKLNAGYSRITLERVSVLPKKGMNPAYLPVSSSIFAGNIEESFIVEPFADFTKKFGPLDLLVLAGGTFQQATSFSSGVEGINYPDESLLYSMGAAGELRNASSSFAGSKYVSAFARLNARWKDSYIVSFNFRRDGSTRFGPGKRFGNFGSVAGGWILSNESFVKKKFRFLSYAKLRVSAGITGNDQVQDFAYLSSYGTGGTYQDVSGLSPLRSANPDYSWETNRKLDIGLELGFWNDRLMVTGTYYNNRSGNQLVPYPLPSQAGFAQYTANLPALVMNAGAEFEVNSVNIRHTHFTWRTYFNITVPSNKLLKYPGLNQSGYASTYVLGQDLSVVKNIHFLGVDPQNGAPLFEDVNKDGLLRFPDDFQTAGKRSPGYYGGLGNNFSFGHFEGSLFLQFVNQRSPGRIDYPGYDARNTWEKAARRWRKTGDVTGVPRPIVSSIDPASAAVYTLLNSDYAFLNTSYLRLKTIQLSYSFAERLLKKWKIMHLALFIQGQNILTFTGRRFIDPETLNGLKDTMPVIRQLAGGIHLTL